MLRVARHQEGLVTLRQCLARGMTARQVTRRAERKEWERVARGVYDTGTVQPETLSAAYDHRRRRTALLGPLAHPGAAAVGVSALVLHGVHGAPIEFEPEVAVGLARPRLGDGPVRVRRILVPETVEVDGVPCAPLVDAFALAVSRRSAGSTPSRCSTPRVTRVCSRTRASGGRATPPRAVLGPGAAGNGGGSPIRGRSHRPSRGRD